VTSQTYQIQELIRQIDEALRKSSPRLPWLQSAEVSQQRQVLNQTRSYLMALQQEAREAEERPLTGSQPEQFAGSSAESAQQVLQAVLQEMNYLRTNMLQPLHADIDALQHRREALTQEIQQLETQRQQALPPANNPQFVGELLQSSMQQLQENLTGQVAHMVASLSAQSDLPLLGGGEDSLSPAQRLQHMQRMQTQSDQLMMRLDSAIRIIFESMQSNIQSYEDSLEQGLNRMHTLGQQGEAMFSALVSRLAEHLGRETSTYLQSSIQVDVPTSGFLQESDAEIDQLLDELNALEDAEPSTDFSELDLGLDPLDFSTDLPPVNFSDDEEITLFQNDFADDFADEDVTRFQDGSELLTPFPNAIAEEPDLSSAMDLLNQLNGDEAEADEVEAVLGGAIAHDEFYQSLFGESAESGIGDAEIPAPLPESLPDAVADPEPAAAADMSDVFFSGMGDPADAESEPEADAPDYPAADLSQSVEAFLLRTPEPEPAAAPEVETIAALSDLISSPDDTAAHPPEDENSYEPAHPDENLLKGGESQPIMMNPEDLPSDARQFLEADLFTLESAALPPDPVQVQADMTLFDDSGEELPFPSDNSLDEAGLALDDFDFADSAPPEAGSTLDGLSLEHFDPFAESDPSDSVTAESTTENAMPQESSTPIAQNKTGFDAFSFDGLDDELFEPSPEPKAQPLEPEDLLKKKRVRSKGESGRGFGR
jgi:hypothetical protein